MKFYKQLFFSERFYQVGGITVVLFVLSYFIPLLFGITSLLLLVYVLLTSVDIYLLFSLDKGLHTERSCAERFSNGEENTVTLYTENNSTQSLEIELIDEAPIPFQLRNLHFDFKLPSGDKKSITYTIRPTERGEYFFGDLILFVKSRIGLVRRKVKKEQEIQAVKVYPSFQKLKKFELMAFHTGHMEGGVKKVRRLGQQKEFDQIKEYVAGDDFRSINWKATARSPQLMVNHYQDEKAQQVYAVLDMGRSMKMPFNGMTLLDYSINASLVLLHIAQSKQDLIGISAFNSDSQTTLKAQRKSGQMQHVLEKLYNLSPSYKETDFGVISAHLRSLVKQRSLLIFFTNIPHKESLERKLPYLKRLAKKHLLVVILFEDSEIKSALKKEAESVNDFYLKALQEENILERRVIAKALQQHGIHTILSTPENLTVDTINKYLEIKARGLL
ncbi:DUF58 domain-containing protein [Flammeovirga kamogawensis]|uniref:DUF58 domain-containing protein n=1 Tax=Flammeovirga kamogawensis TaxID=373891 RepID=A0ABX8H4G9_9BACT|nr:DUF58 domain-containing protein [Flammeovirga kamogawensis]MBB6460496.1 uncharacterized protein (DUF58 family) [Flammeovirga kamogawensis]QWG10302.1 DUF58 domain-containing protein [Flammeovirga kamogawensis]TRX64750.1 DUF58 domain-containing protein [Flammeovirga kamogawensis]